MLRIAICDDELSAREALEIELEKILDEDSEKIVYSFSTGETALRWLYSHPREIDVLFLDIELKNKNGMETAREIRKFNEDIIIVFATGYTDYVFDGYQVNALDYLVKPIQPKRLGQVMKRIRESMAAQEDAYFSFHNIDGTYRFMLKEIDYFYSDRRLVVLVSKNKEYPFYGKLSKVAERLEDTFVRVHQRYLVNPSHVNYIGNNQVTIDNMEIPMSRSYKESATDELARYIIGGDCLCRKCQ